MQIQTFQKILQNLIGKKHILRELVQDPKGHYNRVQITDGFTI